MNDERVAEEIVTKFLLDTCRLRPKLSRPAVQAVVACGDVAAGHLYDDARTDLIPLITGSVAEFYIEPMIEHVGDIDVMFHYSNKLVIPAGHPPPTQLPDEFNDYVHVLEIVDSHLPGYVYLKVRYLLAECVDDGKYIAVEYDSLDRQRYWSNVFTIKGNRHIHGPAFLAVTGDTLRLSSDNVPCARCLVWPSQAADWPTRHRNYGWPYSATVDRVVSNGCDVVPVAHRQCRQDEWMSKHQWRLSFSRAEIVLINSWMPVQQIVYHMLRFFMKIERLIESADNPGAGKLSNYHIKTLMLWACELKPNTWWTDDFSLIRICNGLLHDLAVWLTQERCPHYFVNNWNLIDNSFNFDIFHRQLTSISNSWLSSWFVDNYTRRCSQLCPDNVSRLFDDISTITNLQNAVSAIVDLRRNTALHDMFQVFPFASWNIASAFSASCLTPWSLVCWLDELRKISDSSLSVFFASFVLLHVACRTQESGLTDELMDVLAVLAGQSVGPRRYSGRRSSESLLNIAASLMKAEDDRPKSRSTVDLIAIELSKAYLYRALRCEDSDSDCIYCLANVYLAVLYYFTGHYQTAIDHCTLVTRSQNHAQCSSHVVQLELLTKTDDDIDIVLGLAVFYQHVRIAALNQRQQTQHVTVFTTELFAHYLLIKCLSVTKCQQLSDTTSVRLSTCEVRSYLKYVAEMQQPFIADVLLWKLSNGFSGHQCVYSQQSGMYPTKCHNELNTSDLVELLQKSAVEHLTNYRRLKAGDFGSIATIVTTDFEALYAYKRGKYQLCLQLSTQNVHTLMYEVKGLDSMTICREFNQLLDDDIVSLNALMLLADPRCRDDNAFSVHISQVTLSLYLMTQCQLKLRHSVISLAQTLDYIKVSRSRHPVEYILNQLILKMIARKAVTYCVTTQTIV